MKKKQNRILCSLDEIVKAHGVAHLASLINRIQSLKLIYEMMLYVIMQQLPANALARSNFFVLQEK